MSRVAVVVLFALSCLVFAAQAQNLGPAFGVENGKIPDYALSASSAHGNSWGYYGPQFGRLNMRANYGGWLPAVNSAGQWMQIDLGQVRTVGGVATQGGAWCHGGYFVRSYYIMYSMYGMSDWNYYSENGGRKLFNGNFDCTSIVKQVFQNPFQARYVRIVVDQFNGGWPVLRAELYAPEGYDASEGTALGIQTGLSDKAFTASSCHGSNCDYYGPQFARLHSTVNYGGWIPAQNRGGEWVQVDFGKNVEVGTIATQGRAHGSYWVTWYTIQFSLDGNEWKMYNNGEDLRGNDDYWSVVTNDFDTPFTARYVRLAVSQFANGWPTLRWELYSPRAKSQLTGPPLGISNGKIQDNALTASSAYGNNWDYYGPRNARLYSTANWGGWIPSQNRVGEWVQVDLGSVIELGGVATQGRQQGACWVSSYWIVYSNDNQNWTYYTRAGERVVFMGNGGDRGDYNTVVKHVFETPFLARYVRLVVHNFACSCGWPGLRWEVYAPHSSRAGASLDILGKAFGIEDGTIPDSALTASSAYAAKGDVCAAPMARLNSKKGAGGWVAAEADSNQWLQIATGDENREIGGFAIQGRAEQSEQFPGTKQWVTAFALSYSKDGNVWIEYKEFGTVRYFRGNIDSSTVQKVALHSPFTAKFVRIIPVSWMGHISMRLEMYDTVRYQRVLAETEAEKKRQALIEEEKKAAELKEKLAAEEKARKQAAAEAKQKEIELKDKERAAVIAADNAKTEAAKAAAEARFQEAKKQLAAVEEKKLLDAAKAKEREAQLEARKKEVEDHEANTARLIQEARDKREKYVAAQKKLELLNIDFVQLRKQGIEKLRERTARLEDLETMKTNIEKAKQGVKELKRKLQLLQKELNDRRERFAANVKAAQNRAYEAYLNKYNPYRRTGEDNWPYPKKRMCTCQDTDDPSMKALLM